MPAGFQLGHRLERPPGVSWDSWPVTGSRTWMSASPLRFSWTKHSRLPSGDQTRSESSRPEPPWGGYQRWNGPSGRTWPQIWGGPPR